MDLDLTLQEYQIQLEQVEFALKSDPENAELHKLKVDLEEVIKLTQDLIGETADERQANEPVKHNKRDESSATDKMVIPKKLKWKTGDKCLAIWRLDSQYYPAVVDQIIEEDGSCTVIFDGYKTSEMVQVSQLMPRTKTTSNADSHLKNSSYDPSKKKPLTKRELEQKLREAKKRKREKFDEKMKNLEELSEKEKNKWKTFNNKLASKTWKGVVKKSKFELPSNHENKIGVGTNSLLNRPTSSTLPTGGLNTSASAAAGHVQSQQQSQTKRYKSESYKQAMF